MNFDANTDGKRTQEELPVKMHQRFGRMDENGDGIIDQEEVDAMVERISGGNKGAERFLQNVPTETVFSQ